MADVRAELRQALAVVEGPLRFAQKTDQTLLALRGFGELVGRAVTQARKLPLTEHERETLDRLITHAAAFDGRGLEDRRRLMTAITTELKRLAEPPDHPPPSIEPSPPPRKRIRSLSAEASLAPVDVEGDELSRPLSALRGIGPVIAEKLAARSLRTMGDVLLYLPRTYEDRRQLTPVSELIDGQQALIKGRIVAFHEKFAGRRTYELEVADATGTLTARWFGFRPGQYRGFLPDAAVILSGAVRVGSRGRVELIHPDLELGEKWSDEASFGRIIPVYTDIEGLSTRAFRKLARLVVSTCALHIQDFLPPTFRSAHDLMSLSDALTAVHFPDDGADVAQLIRFSSPAQRRLVFDELFFVQLGLALKKRGAQVEEGIPFEVGEATLARALERLPFQLTHAQRRSLDEIATDIAKPTPMNRLLQGDVGSGKTAVALAAALVAVENGYQAVIMAPTELLAEQHLRTFERLLGGGLFEGKHGLPPIRTGLLSSSRKPKELERTRNELRSGAVRIAVGTHALIQDGVEFHRLGLVVIDEQHRFGVIQRGQLMKKGAKPHVLVMTATPIPRTLALTLYGDLDVSIIDELPPGRTPVTTRLFTGRSRHTAYDLVRKQVAQGQQAYVVLPLVEESDKLDLRAATEEADRLQKEEFSDLKVGLVHGRMSSEERTHAMDAFRRGELQILVATTVIEVGVDVPNASVMLIEHAERFGLSQLHQLRGRVGRGAAKSYCLLVAEEERASESGRERLDVMVRTSNGFELAEADLEIRGPGEFLGTKQSGVPDLVVANLLRDQVVLQEAREAAFRLIASDPDLQETDHRSMAAELARRWAGKLSLARIA
jgi:ATP-dependent DNA helicase RecG